MPRPLVRTAVPAGLAAVLLLTLTPAAHADDPAHPGAEQVRAAREAAGDRAADVAVIEAELDREAADLDRLDIRAGAAVEAYNGAVALREQARGRALDAGWRLRDANARLAAAREESGRVAARAYRMGGGARLGVLAALLGADTPGDAVANARTMRRVAQDGEDTVERGARAVREATAADIDAERASVDADRSTAAVLAARQRVEVELVAQRDRVADIERRRATLLVELAAARRTTVALETERRAGLAAEARRRAEGQARAGVEARDTRARAERAVEAARRDREARDNAGRPHRPTGGTTPVAATKPARPYGSSHRAAQGAEAAIAFAKEQLGEPYVWGGEGPDGWDCSGLVMQAWRRGGVELTHFAAAQYTESTPVSHGDLRPGDLIFWTDTDSASDIHHVAIALGDERMIHAPRTGDVVKISNMFYMGTPDYYARPS